MYTDRFGMIPVALPQREEQTRIMQGLEAELTELHAAISRVEREIDLIREYRTRLIADVVTGKLDVQAAAAALPEEVEELVEVVEEEVLVLEELVVSVPEEVLAPLLVSVPFRSEDKPVCHWMRGMYRYLP